MARANSSSEACCPSNRASAYRARIGVGATAPRAMRARWILPPSPNVSSSPTPTTAMSIRLRGCAARRCRRSAAGAWAQAQLH